MFKKHSLESLMKRAQQGDNKAYGRLFKEITPLLRSFVRKKLQNAHDYEDIVQEILISIHKAGHTYDTDRSFSTWMFTIARYRIADHLRSVYAKIEKGDEVDIDDELYQISDESNVTEEHENNEYLDSLMKHLSPKQRQIIIMMKIEGHTAQEVADMLGMKESAVKVSAHRAQKILAEKALKDQ